MTSTGDSRLVEIKSLVGAHPDFPKKGILFRDVFPVMRNPKAFGDLIDIMTEHIQKQYGVVDVILGLDSRGFIFAPMIAQKLGCSFQPIRKGGKLPGKTIKESFSLEYGTDTFEVQEDAVKAGDRVVLVDDLIATGGSLVASCNLMTALKANILGCLVVIELVDLKGKDKLTCRLDSLLQYEGE